MLQHLRKWTLNSAPFIFPHPTTFSCSSAASAVAISPPSRGFLKIRIKRAFGASCRARRRVIYDDDNDDDENKEYGYNEELAMLESYAQVVKDEILLVQAMVDEELVEVVIFKGFSSCLSYETSSDPSRSVLPAKAVIKTIDRAKGPFDPSNVQYIEKGLTFDAFKSRLSKQN